MAKEKTRNSEQPKIEIKDFNVYLLIFKTRKAEIEGNEAMSQLGVRQGTFIDGKHVSIVRGYQVKELERLGIPYQFLTRKPKESSNDEIGLRR